MTEPAPAKPILALTLALAGKRTIKDPALAPAVRRKVGELRNPIYRQWASQLEAAGWSPDEAVKTVRAGASLVSGTAVRRFWADSDSVTAEIEEDWIAGRLARRAISQPPG